MNWLQWIAVIGLGLSAVGGAVAFVVSKVCTGSGSGVISRATAFAYIDALRSHFKENTAGEAAMLAAGKAMFDEQKKS